MGDDLWLCTLASRLRAHFLVNDFVDDDASAERADDTTMRSELGTRLEELRRRTVAGSRYRIAEVIDSGGMGRVGLAFDEALGRTVAIKQVVDSSRSDARHQLRLLGEAALVGQLQHPGIVAIHDVGVDANGAPFFAMPRIDGKSFARVLADLHAGRVGEWSQVRVLEVLRRVCEAMAYAHARGIAHRDLKPANIMVGSFGEVYVVDWGLAASDAGDSMPAHAAARQAHSPTDATAEPFRPTDLTRTGTVLGTPAYMPPERAAASTTGHAGDVPADIYAVGAMLYEVLSGAPPFLRERDAWTVTSILTAIRERPPTDLRTLVPDVDRELAAICQRAMHRDPLQRYAGMQELADDLRAWAEGRIVAASGGGALVRLGKWVRRNRALFATMAAASTVLLVTTAWFVWHLAAARENAQANLRDLLDLAVVQRVRDLERRADGPLWPATAENVDAMRDWLEEAQSLEATHTRLRARAQLPLAAQVRATGGDVEATWRRRLLDEALAALDSFFATLPADTPAVPLQATVAGVRTRMAAADDLETRSTANESARRRWQQAARHAERDPRYAGLAMRAQSGLLPLGPDPVTGLLEFAHLQTGDPAERDASGNLVFTPESGAVLVLLPAGAFWMGASPGGPHNIDALAETLNEAPVHRVELAAFLIGKHELTQAQWQHATGDNPSVHTQRSTFVAEGEAPRHPVESIDWNEAREVLHKLGLQLPTEAQWEYAARASSSTPWWCAAEVADLVSPAAGNLADASSARALGVQGWMPTPGLDDGYVMHAPVGRFPANPFGLHDVLGNVWEWCDDEYVAYATPPVAGTGARPHSEAPTTVMYRGGAFDQPAPEARSANRAGAPSTRRHFSIGLRPARAWR